MEESKRQNGISFREFLEKSVNLITVFGVLNALFVYSSTTLQKSSAFEFLGTSFYILSLVVWMELIIFTFNSSDGTWKYNLFIFLCFSVGIGFLILFYEFFHSLIGIGLVMAIFFGLVFLTTFVAIKILKRPLSRLKKGVQDWVIYIILLTLIFVSALILKKAAPIILSPIVKTLISDSTDKKDTINH